MISTMYHVPPRTYGAATASAFALLFVDIADSTPLYERLGDAAAAALTRKMLRHLRLVIDVNGGQVIKVMGDGLLAAFPGADDAVWAAGTMTASQETLGLNLRLGLHYGTAIQGDGDLYGDACNVAARVEALARPGEALATDTLVRRLSPTLAARAVPLKAVRVKGKTAPIHIYSLTPAVPEAEEPPTTGNGPTIGLARSPGPGFQTAEARLHLSYRGRNILLLPGQPRLTIGRDDISTLRILSRCTSRRHAVIEYSRGAFIVTDHSTNGTYLQAGAARPVAVVRDHARLVGAGLLGFGAEPGGEDEDHVVAFCCETA
ncbi:class 3 adenylate cyclase [Azospirillum fermentarium]|uniref:adenylate/guanylate cyclase domain-containing protein n=1 Tax=Azospirillum fermentarium TaxID=1233114 RepID=UPI0022274ADA|nr:adenylate/guanylate cyclase domain-containing protein [Azospirillum fermentarium]MCW2245980.1 class 3 adenylate cyclase [Azospirillum fermentarium]